MRPALPDRRLSALGMSAYGNISNNGSSTPLPSTIWPIQSHPTHLTIHHLTLGTATRLNGLVGYLHVCFERVVEEGLTYPQEGELGRAAFVAYFFAADVFVAIVGDENASGSPAVEDKSEWKETEIGIEHARRERPWDECVAGFYYVKPNYPGRSSHICNAGFVVPMAHRSRGYGTILAKSFLYYAPRLHYEASVFNLVYVNNTASVRLWESLGFTKIGLIPRAGRMRRKDGRGEEFVDAWVFYRQFRG